MKKKIAMMMMALSLTFGAVGVPQTVFAASGSTSVSVSSGSVNIGDTVTVTVKASGPSGEKANATMTLSYDSSVLQFVSCNTTYGGGGGSVMATGESYTVTLKAVSAGNSSLSVSANDGVIFDSNEEMDSMSGSSASVTVKCGGLNDRLRRQYRFQQQRDIDGQQHGFRFGYRRSGSQSVSG